MSGLYSSQESRKCRNCCHGCDLNGIWAVSEDRRFTTIIPSAVLGGAMVAMFGMVIAYGIKMLSRIDFAKQENLLIVACSVGLGPV